MTTPALLAIDLGTTQAKAGLVGLDGRLLALARATYPLATEGLSGAAEQDPTDWWAAIRSMT
ncbi:MAG: FGGY family carbohydrate kinase, partial [Candidatus Limnocylindrales bacterium]